MELEDVACLDAIEEKLNLFAEVSGKSRDAVVGFLNELDEDKVEPDDTLVDKLLLKTKRKIVTVTVI